MEATKRFVNICNCQLFFSLLFLFNRTNRSFATMTSNQSASLSPVYRPQLTTNDLLFIEFRTNTYFHIFLSHVSFKFVSHLTFLSQWIECFDVQHFSSFFSSLLSKFRFSKLNVC